MTNQKTKSLWLD